MLLIAALALPSLGMTCGPGPAPPPPDDCGSPTDAPVAGLALGPERLVGRPFEAWAASDTAYITHGAQGGDMLGVALELAGPEVPACLAQRTELAMAGEVLAAAEVAIHTYDEQGDGTRVTHTLWLVLDDGAPYPAPESELDLTSEAGGTSAAAHLVVVSDRHRLLALAPVTATPRAGDTVEFRLDSLHAPAGSSFEVELATAGDPGVLALPAATAWIYNDAEALYIPAAAPGSAELVVRYGEQEVRVAITVE
jgi:hypothetical protein